MPSNVSRQVTIIPARLNATRLPRKPLLEIAGVPMIVHVWRRAIEAATGPVYVATNSAEIASVISEAGGTAIMTCPDHESGSDRIFEALSQIDPEGSFETIINLQGDLPTLKPHLISKCAQALETNADIGTIAAEIKNPAETHSPDVVKVVGSPLPNAALKALYFSRAAVPYGPGPLYHHIGIYSYRREALARFVESAAVASGKKRAAGTIARAGSWNADQCCNCGYRPARRRHARRS